MYVYFSPDAYTHLKARSLVTKPAAADGLIFGHKRGPAFFVEEILPTCKGFFSSTKKYRDLQNLYRQKVIGFFTFSPDDKKTKKIMAPFACGKLYIEVESRINSRLDIKPFLIDYEKNFFLSPLRCKKPPVKG